MSLSTSPRVLKGGLILIDPNNGSVQRIISLQYNPESMTRTLAAKTMGEGADQSEVLRLTGPATETIRLEVEIDATDRLENPDANAVAVEAGIAPDIAALEHLVNPRAADLSQRNRLAAAGTLEIAPVEGPLALLVWGANRVVPVRVTEFSVSEDAFDPALNPIRAAITLGFTVLSIDDLGFDSKGGRLFMAYLQSREQFASRAVAGSFDTLGLGGAP